MIAQVGQRGEHVVNGGTLRGGLRRRNGKVIELVFELHHQALGQLFANAGNMRQLRMILAANGLNYAFRIETAENLDSQLRTDPADGNQPLEEPLDRKSVV